MYERDPRRREEMNLNTEIKVEPLPPSSSSSFKALKEDKRKSSSRSGKSSGPRQRSRWEKAIRFIKNPQIVRKQTSVTERKEAGQFIPSWPISSILLLSFLFNQQRSRFMVSWRKTAAATAEIQNRSESGWKYTRRRRRRGRRKHPLNSAAVKLLKSRRISFQEMTWE